MNVYFEDIFNLTAKSFVFNGKTTYAFTANTHTHAVPYLERVLEAVGRGLLVPVAGLLPLLTEQQHLVVEEQVPLHWLEPGQVLHLRTGQPVNPSIRSSIHLSIHHSLIHSSILPSIYSFTYSPHPFLSSINLSN